MKIRGLAAVAILTTAALATTAGAAPKPCKLIVDAKGDTASLGGDGPAEPAYDVVSADVASNAKVLTAVIRMDKLSKTATLAPTGMAWRTDFLVGEQGIFVAAYTTNVGDKFRAGYINAQGTSTSYAEGTATGVFDTAKNEVRVSMPISAAAAQATLKPGTKITGVRVSVGEYINTAGGNPSLSFGSDTAEGTKPIVLGSKSCVVVGK